MKEGIFYAMLTLWIKSLFVKCKEPIQQINCTCSTCISNSKKGMSYITAYEPAHNECNISIWDWTKEQREMPIFLNKDGIQSLIDRLEYCKKKLK